MSDATKKTLIAVVGISTMVVAAIYDERQKKKNEAIQAENDRFFASVAEVNENLKKVQTELDFKIIIANYYLDEYGE